MSHSEGPPSVNLDPESLNAMSRNFWNSAVLRAAIKLDVFSIFEEQRLTFEQMAEKIGADPRFLQAFLDACVALKLVEKDEGTYGNSASASRFLIKGKEQYVGDLILHITNHWDGWGKLDQLVRDGRTLLPFDSGFVDESTLCTR